MAVYGAWSARFTTDTASAHEEAFQRRYLSSPRAALSLYTRLQNCHAVSKIETSERGQLSPSFNTHS